MAASGYQRQSAATIASGQPVASAPVNNEFNQLVAAFSGTSGHDHSGGTGLGPNLTSAAFGINTTTAGLVNATGTLGALSTVTLTGTANQITVVNGTGAAGNPTVSIATGYVGQASITTLGTIATGVWNGTAVGSQYGGTGQNFSATTGIVSVSSGTFSAGTVTPSFGGTGVNNGSSTITLGGNLTTAGSFTTSGANPVTLTSSGSTNVTLPLSGTLVNNAVTTLSSLVSIGTVTTGVWQGTVVSPTFGGTGVNNGSATLTMGGNVTHSGAFTTAITVTGNTTVTLPTSGTLVNSSVTALSSLVSVGTIGTGVWQGTVIGSTYGGTGINNGSSTITLGGSLTFSGAFTTAITITGNTTVTLPTSGTLITSAVTSLSSLTTVGTIGTGVWQGTVVGPTFGGTGLSAYTQGDILYASASNTLSRLAAAASAGSVLASGGAGANPSWVGGGMVLLSTVNASGAAAIAFGSTLITNKYSKYVIEFDSVVPGTNGVSLVLQVSQNNGGTIQNTNYYWAGNVSASGTAGGPSGGPASSYDITASLIIGNGTGANTCGTVRFANPSATPYTMFRSDFIGLNGSAQAVGGVSGGSWQGATGAINYVTILCSTGTISGNFHLYGITGT